MATTVTYNQREPFRGAGYNPAGDPDADKEFRRGAGDPTTEYTEDNDE